MINVSESVIDVDISVESATLSQDAFSTICFITKGESSLPDNIVVNKLSDLLDAGYTRSSKAYNFCYGVFLQGTLNNIIVRRCLTNESYLESYKKYSNSGFYYLVLESKSIFDITSVVYYLDSLDALKLVFFSSKEDFSKEIKGLSRVVYYYLDSLDSEDNEDYLLFDEGQNVILDDGTVLSKELDSEIKISCEGATQANNYQNVYLNGNRYTKMKEAKIYFIEKYLDDSPRDSGLDIDMNSLLGPNGSTISDRTLFYNDFIIYFIWTNSNSSGYTFDLKVENNSVVNRGITIKTENVPEEAQGNTISPIDISETLCLKNLDKVKRRAIFYDENQVACPRSTGDGGINSAYYRTDLSEYSGFYIKIYANKYLSGSGGQDSTAIFEKDYIDGSIKDLLEDSDYQNFIVENPLEINLQDAGDSSSQVTINMGDNTEYLEHVFQINIASNTDMKFDYDASWQKISQDHKNVSFCLHKHGS